MPIKVHVSKKLVWNAAAKYSIDPKRVFMEFIDNSLDSAEDFFDEKTNSYKKDIKINVLIDYQNNLAVITDNCTWIDDIWRVVQTIWNSNKASVKSKNWQFWFGMFSFISIAEFLTITSKLKWETAKTIKIPKDIFFTWDDDDALIGDPTETTFKYESGTEITISGINKTVLKKDSKNYRISIDDLVNEVWRHFEWLLERKNLEITITDGIQRKLCTPFEYDKYTWDVYESTINHEDLVSKGYEWDFDVKIFLKITENKKTNRPPFFMIKGRRIYDIKDCNEFIKKSAYAKTIWDHPSVIWYIDLWDTVEPVLERDWFNMMWKKWDICRTVFKKIAEKEWEIIKLLDKINRTTEDKNFKKLEDKLTSILAKLAKQDKMNYRRELSRSWDTSSQWFEWAVEWVWWDLWNWAQDFSKWNTNDSPEDRNFWWWEWDWFGPDWKEWDQFPWDKPADDSKFKWSSDFWDLLSTADSTKKAWFSIRFKDWEPMFNETTGKYVRSNLVGWEIQIFKEHPDFIKRKDYWKNWELILTPRLITYLAWEITVYYKDEFFKKNWQPEFNKDMFESIVEFIYDYENELSEFTWKPLSSLS